MEFPTPEINEYLLGLSPPRNPILKEMEALAEEQMFPAVGPLVGRFLFQLVKLSKAKRIFELGSGFGYSALWMAMACEENAQIICTEFDKARAEAGMKFLERADQRHKVLYEVGDAIAAFKRYQGPFDMIFCDVDKEQYPEVIELAVARLRRGGILLADNTLWSGRILDETDQSPATKGIRQFNEIIFSHPRLFSTLIPLRDGVSLSIKMD